MKLDKLQLIVGVEEVGTDYSDATYLFESMVLHMEYFKPVEEWTSIHKYIIHRTVK